MTNHFHGKLNIVLILGVALSSGIGFGKNSGGGGSSIKASIGVEATLYPSVQTWVQGKKDKSKIYSKGSGWMIYATDYSAPKQGVSLSIPSLAIWGNELENDYYETDPSGAKAKEVMKSQGIGLGLVGHDPGLCLALAVVVGVERLYINQSGDTPRAQKYPYGFSSRVGLGVSPLKGPIALDLRVDWIFKHFPTTKSGSDSLKAIEQQSFSPTIGISYNN
jgi:hypothetical protein